MSFPIRPIINGRQANVPPPNGKCRFCGKRLPAKDSFKDKRFYSEYYCPRPSKCRKHYGIWIYLNYTWKGVRERVLFRDKDRCVICTGSAEEVDHIQAISLGGDPFDINNLRLLCKIHHKKKTKVDIVKLNYRRKNIQYKPLTEYMTLK
jgi:5-methylcytosine-specific restriction endonuclease McrA